MAHQDRRNGSRAAASFLVSLMSASGKQIWRSRDLGRGGMQIDAGRTGLQQGERVELAFRFPATDDLISCEGMLVWEEKNRTGIQFTEMPQHQLSLIDEYVDERADEDGARGAVPISRGEERSGSGEN